MINVHTCKRKMESLNYFPQLGSLKKKKETGIWIRKTWQPGFRLSPCGPSCKQSLNKATPFLGQGFGGFGRITGGHAFEKSQLPSNQRPAESQAPTQNLGQGRKPDFQTRPCVHSPFPPFSFWFLKKNKVGKKKMMFPFCYYWGWRADRLHRLAWQEKKLLVPSSSLSPILHLPQTSCFPWVFSRVLTNHIFLKFSHQVVQHPPP